MANIFGDSQFGDDKEIILGDGNDFRVAYDSADNRFEIRDSASAVIGYLSTAGVLTLAGGLVLGASATHKLWMIEADVTRILPDPDAPCGGPTARAITNCDFYTLDFDAATDEVAYLNVFLPPQYSGGQLKLELYWTALSGSGAVVWVCDMKCLAHDAVITAASRATQSVTSTLTAANDLQRTEFTVTPNGAAANTWLQILIRRDADNGSDTLAVDALVIGLNLTQVQ